MSIGTRAWVLPALLAAVCAGTCGTALAQGDGGFVTKLRATATGEELSRQPGLWVCEVSFKPMRYMRVEVTDPKTGKKTRELIWYVCYKAINRPLGQKKATDIDPVNDYDPAPSKPFFVPEFTLVTDDNGVQKTYHDIVLPEAQVAILKERDIAIRSKWSGRFRKRPTPKRLPARRSGGLRCSAVSIRKPTISASS